MSGSEDARARARLLRVESVIATIINTAISIAFFFLIFGWHDATARDLAIDFAPQSLGVGLLGGVIPALILRARLRSGRIKPAGPTPRLIGLMIRIGIVILLALACVALPVGLILVAAAPAVLSPLSALLLKAVYGGVLGLLTTPPILKLTLGMRVVAHGHRRTSYDG